MKEHPVIVATRVAYDKEMHPVSNDILSVSGADIRMFSFCRTLLTKTCDQVIANVVAASVRVGFIRAVAYTLQLAPNALLHAGPPCSSWVWISRGSTKRSKKNPMGNKSYQSTQDANTQHGVKFTGTFCYL